MTTTIPDPYAATLSLRSTGLLREFNRAGVLNAADVHTAQRLGASYGEADDGVLLAAALVVRSTRHGSVVFDLDEVEELLAGDEDGSAGPMTLPPWPVDWRRRCAASPLVGRPLRMAGSRLWLARYWEQEEDVAAELLARTAVRPDDLEVTLLDAGLDRLFVTGSDDDQRAAARICALSQVSVLAGGPGTGKTTTVARLLALLKEQHPAWRIALAAPTGKAAARLEEAVRSSTDALPAADRERLGALPATTLHRLLGWRPESRSRFRHDRSNRLPVDVVVVDESSMLSLTLMARLLEALRHNTRLILVGDPYQLASVEAGAVLADMVDAVDGPDMVDAVDGLNMGDASDASDASTMASTTPVPLPARWDGVAVLRTNRRFDSAGAIAALAGAVRNGRSEEALDLARRGSGELEFVEIEDGAALSADQWPGVRSDVQRAGETMRAAAARGDAAAALAAMETHRLLCAHRHGSRGVGLWGSLAEQWLDGATQHGGHPTCVDGRYLGEPLLVTANDHDAKLYNGDTGVVVAGRDGDLVAAFGRGGAPIYVPLVRLGTVRPLHAMTIHRSQGSQYERVTVVLPVLGSALTTRETLYTALTRATSFVRILGSADAFVAAIDRPAARATGLRDRLLGELSAEV